MTLYKMNYIVYEFRGKQIAKTCENLVYGTKRAKEKIRKGGKFACGAALVKEIHTSDKKLSFIHYKYFVIIV